MKIRMATDFDRDEYYKLVDYCFEYPHSALKLEMELFDKDQCIIHEDDKGKIIGGTMVYPFNITYGNRVVPMGGISIAVADPTIRYNGYTSELIKYAIKYMHDKGMVFSTLEPFLYKFYRKYGWELAYDKFVYDMDIDAFNTFLDTEFTYDLCNEPVLDDIYQVHNNFVNRYSGAVVRSHDVWNKYINILKGMNYYFCTCSLNNIVKGYMIYKISGESINVREIMWEDISAYKALLGYIYRHNSQCEKVKMAVPTDDPLRQIIDEPNRRTYLKTVMMNRIIDVKKAFELGRYNDIGKHNIMIKVNDKYAPWNDGYWCLDIEKGSIKANKTNYSIKTDIEIDIQSLSQMLIGYCSVKKLYEIEKLKIYNNDIKDLFFSLFTSKCTYMNQKF